MDREIRQITTQIELRADNEGGEVIEGYALKFERWSEKLGVLLPFKEIISRGALDNTDMSDVVALFNHQMDYPLARNTVSDGPGSLKLTVDDIGLKFRFIPTDTSYARDLINNVKSGVINKCSFAFSLNYDDPDAEEISFNEESEIYERRINKIDKLYDISIVTSPAYSDTEAVIGQRSKEKMEEIRHHKTDQNEIEKIKLELDLLEL